MVCVKLPNGDHDFYKDPIELEINDGWLTAKGTTLGADDGIAVAICWPSLQRRTMFILRSSAFYQHGGDRTLGASRLDASVLAGKRMINMDGGASDDSAAPWYPLPEAWYMILSQGGV